MSDSDIVKDFLVESYENLDRLDRDLVGLEKNPHDKDALAGVFRTIHTIKGTCGFLGFNKLEKVAHVGENLLTRLRDGQLTLNPELTTALLGMVDAVRQMLKEIESTGQDGEVDYPELRETLTRLQNPGAGGAGSNPAAAPPAQPVKADAKPPANPPVSSSKLKKNARPAASEEVASSGRAGSQTPAGDITMALQEEEEEDRRPPGRVAADPKPAKPEEVVPAQPTAESRPRDSAAETIRVGVNLLDKLMTQVGELVLARNQLLQLANSSEDTGLQAVSQRMNLIATELQEEVMKTRMQPIGNIWGSSRGRCATSLSVAAKKSTSRWRAKTPSSTRPSSRPSRTHSPTWYAIPWIMASNCPKTA
jgi:two-component system chemotaxis sensor kinase CheA